MKNLIKPNSDLSREIVQNYSFDIKQLYYNFYKYSLLSLITTLCLSTSLTLFAAPPVFSPVQSEYVIQQHAPQSIAVNVHNPDGTGVDIRFEVRPSHPLNFYPAPHKEKTSATVYYRLVFTPTEVGDFEIIFFATDQEGEVTTLSVKYMVRQYSPFDLWNADDEERLRAIFNDDIIYLGTLPSLNLNIRYLQDNLKPGSVALYLNGTKYVEDHHPYFVFKNKAYQDLISGTLPIGPVTLTAVHHPKSHGRGPAGSTTTVNFTVKEGVPPITFTVPQFSQQGQIQGSNVISSDNSIGFEERDVKFVNFPNPNNGESNLMLEVPISGRAVVDIYDLKGALVKRIFDKEAEAGKQYLVPVLGEELSNGIYFYRLQFSNYIKDQKIVISK